MASLALPLLGELYLVTNIWFGLHIHQLILEGVSLIFNIALIVTKLFWVAFDHNSATE